MTLLAPVTKVRCRWFPPVPIIGNPLASKGPVLMSNAAGTETARQSQELRIFHDVAKALTSSLDLDSILQTIMEKMAEYFRPDTWSLLMVDEQKNELYFAIAVGIAL